MTSRTARTILTGAAAGALTLGALSGVPASATDRSAESSGSRAGVAEVSNEKELRRAVRRANRDEGPDRIRLTDSIRFGGFGGSRGGAKRGDLDISADLTVIGAGHTIDARRVDRVFDVRPHTRLTLRGITLTRGAPKAGQNGGAIRGSFATLILRGSTITDSRAIRSEASGGAIALESGRLVVARSRLEDNVATRAGGAIEALEGRTTVRRSRLLRNRAGAEPGNGGALHLTGAGTVRVEGSRIIGNTATAEGGGLWNSADGTMTVEDTILRRNTATGAAADEGGGALFDDGGSLTVIGSTLRGNAATGAAGSGGGILTNGGTLVVRRSTLVGNAARRAGGGIEAVAGESTIRRTTLADNRAGAAPGNGGAFHLTGAGTVDVENSRVVGNRAAAEGGGLWNSATGTFTVTDTVLRGNVARGDEADEGGGALFNDGGSLTVTGSTLRGNAATGESGSGGGILNNGGALTVESSTLRGNDAMRAGGGIETAGGNVSMTDVDALGNRTGDNPGNGGALHLTGAASATWEGGEVSDNTAAAEGGGLWNSAMGMLIANDLTLMDNTAPVGPDAFNDGGVLVLNGEPVPPGSGV